MATAKIYQLDRFREQQHFGNEGRPDVVSRARFNISDVMRRTPQYATLIAEREAARKQQNMLESAATAVVHNAVEAEQSLAVSDTAHPEAANINLHDQDTNVSHLSRIAAEIAEQSSPVEFPHDQAA
ncbi:MAG TPA: hypothetical protein VFN56_05305 [Candidatus Saccharimonadales bacterium]|nr:hypothetical protein [Candidatus Saccharimonadales bacterium]